MTPEVFGSCAVAPCRLLLAIIIFEFVACLVCMLGPVGPPTVTYLISGSNNTENDKKMVQTGMVRSKTTLLI